MELLYRQVSGDARRVECGLCGKLVSARNAMSRAAHARTHVRKGEAVEHFRAILRAPMGGRTTFAIIRRED